VRERLMAASMARGSRGGEFDNRELVLKLAKLRAERATLLGYPNYAAYSLEDQKPRRHPAAVNKLLAELAKPAVGNARKEAADLQKIVDAQKGGFQIAAHDWAFYTDKVRAAQYNFDENQLRPYFELNNVLTNGVFFAANKEYGMTFKERKDLPVYDPDVRVFDVFDADGKQLAIFIFDPYARANKQGGAWMNEYVSQSHLLGTSSGGGEPPEHSEAARRRADPADLRRSAHRLPRIRPCAARHVLEREVPALLGHQRAARLRRVSVAGQRDVGDLAGSAGQLRQALQDRRADAEGTAGQGRRLEEVQPGLHDHRIPGRLAARPALAPADPGADPDRRAGLRSAALKDAGVDFAPVPPRYRTTYFSH
jgi:peptidyl-dipeptidase Dcp